MKKRHPCAGLLVIAAACMAGNLGCASTRQFKTLSDDLAKVRHDLDAVREENRDLARAEKETQDQLLELQKQIREESLRVDVLVEKLSSLGGASAAPRPGSRPVAPPAGPAPSFDPRTMFEEGQGLAARGDYAAAILRLEQLASLFPRDPLADDARLAVGNLYFEQRDFSRALEHFIRVVTEFPDGDRFAEAALQAALAYEQLGDQVKQRAILEELVRRYPDTPEGRRAEELLETMGPAAPTGRTTDSREG